PIIAMGRARFVWTAAPGLSLASEICQRSRIDWRGWPAIRHCVNNLAKRGANLCGRALAFRRWSTTLMRFTCGCSASGNEAGISMVGMLDDKYELRPALKFGGQVLIAAFVALAGVGITLFVPSIMFSLAITILWILTVTNALNFLDNMNGLCTGLGIVGAWACGWSAAVQGQY